jgi:anti-sigma B factor antagonist
MRDELSRSQEPSTIVRPVGGIDIDTSPALRAQLADLTDQCPRRVIIDLSAVTNLDSSGVGTLVEFKRRLERVRGTLVLAGLSPGVRGIFEVLKLDQFFTFVDRAHVAADQDRP